MAPEVQLEDYLYDNVRPSAPARDTSAAEAALNARLSRKRTKTGCLTCRKRRIKCGEERPVCKNCIKSKRHCEGYNQRVVFKHPTYDYRPAPNGGAHITFQAGLVAGPPTAHVSMQAPVLSHSAYLQMQQQHGQPHMSAYDGHHQQWAVEEQPPQQLLPPTPSDFSQYPQLAHAPMPANQSFQHPASAQYVDGLPQVSPVAPEPSTAYDSSHSFFGQDQDYSNVIAQQQQVNGSQTTPTALVTEQAAEVQRPTMYGAFQYSQTSGAHPLTESQGTAWSHSRSTATEHDATVPTPISSTSTSTMSFSQTPITAPHRRWSPNDYVPRPELARPMNYQAPLHVSDQQQMSPAVAAQSRTQSWDHITPELYEYDARAVASATPSYMLDAAAVEIQDDDYYDVEGDDEMDIDTNLSAQHGDERQRKLSKILAMNQISVQDVHMRRYDTFIYAGILDKYRVEEVASPLKNPATARVFAHFISATGPSLSIFERHPRNTSVMFNKSTIPLSQQGLWTYTLPVAALRNQGLLHAMLALGSLHIARLQGASQTPSMQHYAWALKRIHSSVANPRTRGKVTTIAASMLLGFYEVMTADHMKWNTHLAGSKQLFVETDFVNMTKEFRRLKREKAERHQFGDNRRYSSEEPWLQDELLDQIPEVDERVVSHFVGREVRYDDHGSVQIPHVEIPPGLDLNKFEILKDLYWWYCKQDVIQSIVSGNPLLMDFSRWANCPPRAPLGRGDAVYGSFDHLVLLLGRIADFSSKDRDRKLKQIEANGGQWRPAPNMKMPRPPQQGAPPLTPSSATNGFSPSSMPPRGPPANAMPQFYGMAPPPRANVQMPSSYMPAYPIPSPQSARPENPFDGDLSTQTQAALAEYGRIRAALHTFQTSLGKDFEPLSSDYQMPMMTSFGQALFYRSYDIGCLWALYNMAVIIAIRAHPHMPPAAHAAAAISAQETAHFANEIGRIAAGIVPGPADQPLNPSLGAALCESCMPSFFAAVQYQSPQQRYDTVTRIWNIAKRTGWGSAELIANGCETAWVKAAEAGRGPPYTRIARPSDNRDDPRLNGSWENLDPSAQPNEVDDRDRRFVKTSANARLNWAIGVLGVEDDVQKFKFSD